MQKWPGRQPGAEPALILNPYQAVIDESPDGPGDTA